MRSIRAVRTLGLSKFLRVLPRKAKPKGRLIPTHGKQVSLPQGGRNICKPLYSPEDLRKEYHEIKDEDFWRIVPVVHDFTQLSIEALWSLYEAVRYIVAKDIKGDFVECGVFFGGAVMLTAKTLMSMNAELRDIWLYDTFEGFLGQEAADDRTWYGDTIRARIPDFESVTTANVESTGYPTERLKLVKGDIEATAKDNRNGDIALLRLDTDTYYSTKAELEYFYPKLVRGGVLIIDDYGHAFGARRATDEYFADPARRILLHRVNFTNRIGVKI